MKALTTAILMFFAIQAQANTVCQMTLADFPGDKNSPIITMVVSRYESFASVQLVVPSHPTWQETITSRLITGNAMDVLSWQEFTGLLRTESSQFEGVVSIPRTIFKAEHPARVEWLRRLGQASVASIRLSEKSAALLVTDRAGNSSVVAYGDCNL